MSLTIIYAVCVVYLEGVSELEPLQEFPESPEIVW